MKKILKYFKYEKKKLNEKIYENVNIYVKISEKKTCENWKTPIYLLKFL